MALLFFLAGFLFAEYIIPLLDAAIGIIVAKAEVKKTKYSEQITQSQIKMQKAVASVEDAPKRVIGFTLPDCDEDYEEEEDD